MTRNEFNDDNDLFKGSLSDIEDFAFSSDFEKEFNSFMSNDIDLNSFNHETDNNFVYKSDILEGKVEDDSTANYNYDSESSSEQDVEDFTDRKTTNNKIKQNKKTLILRLFLILIMILAFICITILKGNPNKNLNDFNSVITVISQSNTLALNNYAKLNTLASNKRTINQSEYYVSINDIKKSFEDEYKSVESLNSLKSSKNYIDTVNLLEARLKNGVELCDAMIKIEGDVEAKTYNNYVTIENEISQKLITDISNKADGFNIKYKIENNNFILDTK